MRTQLLYNPLLLIERVGHWATEKRRLRRIRGSAASDLSTGHIDSLELLEMLNSSDVKAVYDIGANVGTWTRLAKSILAHAEIHAFEPLPQHVREFRESTKEMDGITLHEIALGENCGKAHLHLTSTTDSSSILPLTRIGADIYNLSVTSTIEVPMESLDRVIRDQNLPQPDLIKLDIQGYELNALRGAVHALDRTRAVIIEVSFAEIYEGQCLFHDVVSFLANRDFYLSSVGHGIKAGANLLQADLLFQKVSA